MTSKFRGSADRKWSSNVAEKQSNSVPFIFHNFKEYDCHLAFEKLIDNRKGRKLLDMILKTQGEDISVAYVGIRFIDSYRYLSSSWDSLVE